MSNPNTVHLIVELGPESQAKLDEILAALQSRSVTNTVNMVTTATVAESADPSTDEEEVTDTPSEDEEPTYTKTDVQKLVQKLAAPDSPKREKAKAIVKEYAAKISAIPESKYPEVMRRLKALDSATK